MAATIRDYEPEDAEALMALFHAAVHRGAAGDYGPAELEAWSPASGQVAATWWARFERTRPFVAVASGRPVGFVELEAGGHVDMLYVHPDHTGRGVGRRLLERVVQEGERRGLARLFVEASRTARPLFERLGFVVLASQRVARGGEHLENFRMERVLRVLEDARIALRRALVEDAEAILGLRAAAIRHGCAGHYSAEEVSRWAGSPRPPGFEGIIETQPFYVAEDGGRVVGCGFLDVGRAEIEAMFVHPAYTGRGVGRAILERLEAEAAVRRLPALGLSATLNAEAFYARMGFEPVARSRWCSPAGLDLACVRMRKQVGRGGPAAARPVS